MMYRVAQRTIFRNINTNLGFLTYDMAKINNQIATGKQVNKPSDDPSGGALILAMRSVLSDVDQYNKDVALADDWLNQTESSLMNMKLIVERANVLAEQMSTDTYQDANMDVSAKEIAELIEGIIKTGNTRIGDRYIFAGQKTEIQPFMNNLTIWNAQRDDGNASSYTGKLLPPADRSYSARPDLPPQTSNYLVEITQAGGVDGDSLASLTIDQAGTHNGLVFSAQNAMSGAAGNAIRVEYVAGPPSTATTTATAVGNDITVTLATDAGGIPIADAQDVINAIEADAGSDALVSVKLEEGNSGSGLVIPTGGFQNLSGGIDNAAMYRVSMDGGLTWGEPSAFDVSELNTQPIIYNSQLGHATMTTDNPGLGDDLIFNANLLGTSSQDIEIEFVDPGALYGPPSTVAVAGNRITVTLAHDGAAITATADEVMNVINADPVAGRMVTASLKDYREGGAGVLEALEPTRLTGADEQVTSLGHATLETTTSWEPPESSPNIRFTAVDHGDIGNTVKVEMVAGGTLATTVTPQVAGDDTVVINLRTDANGDIVATAQEVVEAVNQYYYNLPVGNVALVTANLTDYPEGGGIVEPMESTELAGGDDTINIADFGARIRFENDGSSLTLGDRFSVDVSYYEGDNQEIDLNANQGDRVTSNVNGEEALGAVGAEDNIIDTLARLQFALEQHDTTLVAEELTHLGEALDKLTTEMSKVGVRLIRNQFTYNALDSTEINSTERMSRVEDLDIADAITELQTKQMAYQATLASTSLVTKLSLVDYIR